jgi:group I intron endonuclease
MNKIGIYKITSPSGRVYIGQSTDIDRRWNVNYKNLRCKSQRRLYSSFVYHGVENHTFEIIKECMVEEIPYYERHYQEFYNVLDKDYGLNCKLSKVGEKKQVCSDETRQKMSEKAKGRKLSEGAKRKLSIFLIGNKYNLGKKQSEDHIKKKVEKTKGKKRSEESRKKISESKKGNKNGCKKVINTETNENYNSLKEMCEILGLNYSTMINKLSGHSKNNTNFQYI